MGAHFLQLEKKIEGFVTIRSSHGPLLHSHGQSVGVHYPLKTQSSSAFNSSISLRYQNEVVEHGPYEDLVRISVNQ